MRLNSIDRTRILAAATEQFGPGEAVPASLKPKTCNSSIVVRKNKKPTAAGVFPITSGVWKRLRSWRN